MSSRDLNKRLRMERSNTMELADRRASAIRKERELREAKLPTAWKWESAAPRVAYTVDAKGSCRSRRRQPRRSGFLYSNLAARAGAAASTPPRASPRSCEA